MIKKYLLFDPLLPLGNELLLFGIRLPLGSRPALDKILNILGASVGKTLLPSGPLQIRLNPPQNLVYIETRVSLLIFLLVFDPRSEQIQRVWLPIHPRILAEPHLSRSNLSPLDIISPQNVGSIAEQSAQIRSPQIRH